jgi:hypothetical protein
MASVGESDEPKISSVKVGSQNAHLMVNNAFWVLTNNDATVLSFLPPVDSNSALRCPEEQFRIQQVIARQLNSCRCFPNHQVKVNWVGNSHAGRCKSPDCWGGVGVGAIDEQILRLNAHPFSDQLADCRNLLIGQGNQDQVLSA